MTDGPSRELWRVPCHTSLCQKTDRQTDRNTHNPDETKLNAPGHVSGLELNLDV